MPGTDFLGLDPDAAPARARTAWLATQLRTAVADGRLTAGARLPASRSMANDLGMSRGTVVEAYRRLTEEGLFTTNRGGGTVVARYAASSRPAVPPQPESPASGQFNISEGVPDLTSFPRAAWLRAERRVLATATSRELGYCDPRGAHPLRVALAQWLARSRGITVGPDQILVTAGVTGAVSLICQVLRDRGITACAMEDPGSAGNRTILNYWMDEAVPVPVDAEGLDVAPLERTGARVALVTPAHQFPTGVVMSPARRRRLVEWASAVDGYVIEDDYDSEYRYDRAPVRAMQPAAPERIIHVSSLSKVLAPALRLGWLIAPQDLHDELVHKRWATDLGSPALPQLTLADLIASGVLERQLRSLRLRHRERRDAAVAAIRRYLPGCAIEGVAAGLHLLVTLPDHVDDAELAARAQQAGIIVVPVSALRAAPGPPGIVVGYGPHPTSRLAEAIEVIGKLTGAAGRPF